MSIRAYKWAAGILLCAVLVLGWRCFTLYRQIVTAAFISFQCEATEKFAREQTNPEYLANDVETLTIYYDAERRILTGSPIAHVVQRDYQHALTNALIAFRRITTNDLGDDPSVWLRKYGRH
jgi:hypothetical protein